MPIGKPTFYYLTFIVCSMNLGKKKRKEAKNEIIFVTPTGLAVECSLMAWETRYNPRLSHTKHSKKKKKVLDASLLSTQHYKVCIKGKDEQSRGRSSTLPYTLV